MNYRLITVLILTLLIISLFFIFYTPRTENFVRIEGKVINVYNLSQPPQYISAFEFNPLALPQVPKREAISSTVIHWNGLEGNYTLIVKFFENTPIVLSADCTAFELIDIDYNSKNIKKDLKLGNKCLESDKPSFPEDYETLLSQVTSRKESIESQIRQAKLDSEISDRLFRKLDDVQRTINTATQRKESEAYIILLHGYWLNVQTDIDFGLAKLKICLQNINSTIKKYDSLFFVLPHDDYETFKSVSSAYSIFDGDLGGTGFGRIEGIYDKEELFKEINYLHDNYNRNSINKIGNELYSCESVETSLKNSLDFQSKFYIQRIVFIIVSLSLTFLLGALFDNKYKIINNLSKRLSKIQLPEIKNPKEILSTNAKITLSLTINFGIIALFSASLTIFNQLSQIFSASLWISSILAFISTALIILSVTTHDKKKIDTALYVTLVGIILVILSPFLSIFVSILALIIDFIKVIVRILLRQPFPAP